MTKFLGVLFMLIATFGMTPAFGWDCTDPAVDCSTLIIRTESASSIAALSSANQRAFPGPRPISIIEVPEDEDPQSYLDDLANTPGITFVEPALRIELADPIPGGETELTSDLLFEPNPDESVPLPEGELLNGPNDPLLGNQSHYLGDVGANLGIDAAWSQLTHSPIIVAVIDSGIDYDHPDLEENMWVNIGEIPGNNIDDDGNSYVDDVYGYNFFDDDPDPFDDHHHGTHMAGIIGATGNNGIGVTGMLWDTQLMALRFTGEDGIGNTVKAIQAIHYAIANGARVVNLSWTVNASSSSGGSQGLKDVIKFYSDQGVIFVAASGNGGSNFEGDNIDEEPLYPASIQSPNLISVAASSLDGGLAFFSNFGVNSVHIVAPGYSILSTLPSGRYGRLTGTSAATAVVSGAVAMILAQAPELTSEQLKSLILNSSTYHEEFEGLIQSSGSLNLQSHLEALNDGNSFSTSNPIENRPTAASSGCALTPAGSSPSPETNQTTSFLVAMILLALYWVQRRFVTGPGKELGLS